MSNTQRTLLRYRLSAELGTDRISGTEETLFLRCFPTVAGILAAGLSSEAQQNSQNDDWDNGIQSTGAADAALAADHAGGDHLEEERLLLAIAHMRLAAEEQAKAPVGVPDDMRRWRVIVHAEEPTTLTGTMEVWAQSEKAAVGAAAEAARAATARTAKPMPLTADATRA